MSATEDVLREAADYFMQRDGVTYVVEALCQRRLTGEWPAYEEGGDRMTTVVSADEQAPDCLMRKSGQDACPNTLAFACFLCRLAPLLRGPRG